MYGCSEPVVAARQCAVQYRPDTLPFRLITPSALQLSRVSWADIALLTFAGAF